MIIDKIRRILTFLITKKYRLTIRLRGWWFAHYIRLMGGICGSHLMMDKDCFIKYPPHKGVNIGAHCFLGQGTVIDVPIGGEIILGDWVHLTRGVFIASDSRIEVGSDSLIGEYTSIRDSDHGIELGSLIRAQKNKTKPVCIGENVWLGCRVAVLKGVQIGPGAVIGANSVVNINIPENAVAAGVPVRLIRYRE